LGVDEVSNLHWVRDHEIKGRRPTLVRKTCGAAGVLSRSILFLA
jgi:hypothetical protein